MSELKIDLETPTNWQSPRLRRRARGRRIRETLFKYAGLLAVLIAGLFLLVLLINIVRDGTSGFIQTTIDVDVHFAKDQIGNPADFTPEAFETRVRNTDMRQLLLASLRDRFPDALSRRDQRALLRLFSPGVRDQLQARLLRDPMIVGKTLTVPLIASDDVDQLTKGQVDITQSEANRRLSDQDLAWIKSFESEGRIQTRFNKRFLTRGDSREPELAGIWGAVVGSALTLMVTLSVAFPIGVSCAIYLEEFAPKNRLTDLIEVNINNLAAVPSIVFGLLGLAVFLGLMGLPRSAPLVGGLTLALMTLPTIIISSRAAIRAVPNSIRDAASALGASPMQVAFHHVLPFAMPGILTGTIIGMAQALGETAPLLMVGMVAFIVDIPSSVTDAATVLPVQVYLWADSPERAFQEKTAAAIMVLLFFLIAMNALAIWLRNRFEQQR